MSPEFVSQISQMNEMYRLPTYCNKYTLVDPSWPRRQSFFLEAFKKTISDEVNEIDQIIKGCEIPGYQSIDTLVDLADLLADVIVYCTSEAKKYDIPIAEVLEIVMRSNQSKLGADGNPIYDKNGKFLKGPNYWKPEPEIKTLLAKHYIHKEE